MKNKIIAAIRLTESVINEAEVKYDGDKVVIIKKDGSEERFKPVGLTAAEVVEKFFSIKKHSEGRAWQWLRKVEREEEREEEIEDESTVTTEGEPIVEETPAPEVPAEGTEPIVEEEDSTTECPYHNLLADLLNKENITVQEYEAAIIKFNEATDIPEEKRVRIVEILNHAKDEELEHVKEIQLADDILKGEEAAPEEPLNEPEGEISAEGEVEVTATENPDEVEVTVDAEEETFESIKEAILPDSDIFKLLTGKEFASYEEVEELFTKEGFEVVEVFKEGDGFNVNLRKEGEEFFIPFCACAGKFCATLEAKEDEKLEEGLGDWIAAKVGKVIGKGQGMNARDKLVAKIKEKLGDAVDVEVTDTAILVKPKGGAVVTIGTNVDELGLHLGDFKAIELDTKKIANDVKAAIGQTDTEAKEEPAEEGGTEETPAEDDFSDLDDKEKEALELLKKKGLKISK